MEKIIIDSDIQDNQKEMLLQMIHKAFEEYLGNGLNFTCSRYTLDDLEKKVLSGQCFFAKYGGDIVGVTSVTISKSGKIAYENISAVHPSFKSRGVGTKLFKERKLYLLGKGVVALISDTCVDAKESVRWHISKCGCHKIGYESYPNTNYFSYIFREDLKEVSCFKTEFIYPIRFFLSFLVCVAVKRKNGDYTCLGKIIRKLLYFFRGFTFFK